MTEGREEERDDGGRWWEVTVNVIIIIKYISKREKCKISYHCIKGKQTSYISSSLASPINVYEGKGKAYERKRKGKEKPI